MVKNGHFFKKSWPPWKRKFQNYNIRALNLAVWRSMFLNYSSSCNQPFYFLHTRGEKQVKTLFTRSSIQYHSSTNLAPSTFSPSSIEFKTLKDLMIAQIVVITSVTNVINIFKKTKRTNCYGHFGCFSGHETLTYSQGNYRFHSCVCHTQTAL